MFRVVMLAMVCASCTPCRHLATTRQDSTHVELRTRPVVVTDSVYFAIEHHAERVTVREDSSFLTNPYATSCAIVRPSGELYHTLESIPRTLAVEHELRIEVRDSIIYQNRTETRIIERERELSQWQRLQIRGFWIMLLLLGGVVMSKRFF